MLVVDGGGVVGGLFGVGRRLPGWRGWDWASQRTFLFSYLILYSVQNSLAIISDYLE